MAKKHPLDDCKEMIKITLLFLRVASNKENQFCEPGVLDYASRQMVEIIYFFKIRLFPCQFRLTKRKEKILRDLCNVHFCPDSMKALKTYKSVI